MKLTFCYTICDTLLCSSHFDGFLTDGGKLMAAAVLAAAWMIQASLHIVIKPSAFHVVGRQCS